VGRLERAGHDDAPNYVRRMRHSPQEDFAETSGTTSRAAGACECSRIRRKRKGVPVFEKFLLLGDFVRSLRGW